MCTDKPKVVQTFSVVREKLRQLRDSEREAAAFFSLPPATSSREGLPRHMPGGGGPGWPAAALVWLYNSSSKPKG
jgi:hypothetical protein